MGVTDIGSHKDSNVIYRHNYCFLGLNVNNVTSVFPNLLHDSVIKMCVISDKNSVPLQDWSGPERSRKLRFPDFMTAVQEGGKVVSLTHWPHLPPGNSNGTHFC